MVGLLLYYLLHTYHHACISTGVSRAHETLHFDVI